MRQLLRSGRLLVAALLAAGALAFLAHRLNGVLSARSRGDSLRLPDDVTPGSPPPLADDAPELRSRLRQVEASRAAADAERQDPRPWLALAQAARRAGDFLSARQALQTALRLDPAAGPGLTDSLAESDAMLGLDAEAFRLYEGMIARWPREPRAYVGASRALLALGRREEAARILARASRALPAGDARGHVLLAREYGDRMDYAMALREAQAARAADPGSAEATVELARRLLNTGRLPESRVLLDGILAADPGSDPARRVLAAVLVNPLAPQRNAARAEQLLLEVVQRSPDDLGSLQALGELYMDEGRYRPAAYVYVRALAIRSDLTGARMRLARAYAGIGEAREAARQAAIGQRLVLRDQEERRLQASRGQHPHDPEARMALGLHYERAGQFARALPELEAAWALAGGAGRARDALLDLYRRAGVPPPLR